MIKTLKNKIKKNIPFSKDTKLPVHFRAQYSLIKTFYSYEIIKIYINWKIQLKYLTFGQHLHLYDLKEF